jgi:hypothetical protein
MTSNEIVHLQLKGEICSAVPVDTLTFSFSTFQYTKMCITTVIHGYGSASAIAKKERVFSAIAWDLGITDFCEPTRANNYLEDRTKRASKGSRGNRIL